MNNVLTPGGPADPMAGIGISAKSGHDGLVITNIGLASRALKVGLQQGDIIKAVDGTVVKNTSEMNQALSRKPAGAPVQLIIQRQKQIGTFTL
jgi:serine protease Do